MFFAQLMKQWAQVSANSFNQSTEVNQTHQAKHKHHNNRTRQMQIFIIDFVATKWKKQHSQKKKCDEVFKWPLTVQNMNMF